MSIKPIIFLHTCSVDAAVDAIVPVSPAGSSIFNSRLNNKWTKIKNQ